VIAPRKEGRSLDDENKAAPKVNPEKSGVRSGNPQLDPESARKEQERPRDTPKVPRHARKRGR